MIALIPLLGASALAADNPFPFEIHTTTLDNGLTLHVVPMGTPDVAAVYTWFAVGSRDEVVEGRTGFAHFFEHLAFYGTEALPPDERDRKLLTMGVEENAWTWLDETVYNAVLPAEHAAAYLEMEADRFANLKLAPADVQKEAGAIYGEYRKGAADPGNALSTAVVGAAFTTHTYHHDTIGFEEDIARMPDAFEYSQEFFDQHYRPENATVLVAGDVDPAAIAKVVSEHWSAWERSEEPPPEIPAEPEQTEAREVSLDWPSPTAPQLVMAWKIPAADPITDEVVALQAIADLLFASVGPLKQRLVREEAVAYSVSGWRGNTVDPSLFEIHVRCKTPEDLEKAEAIVREELTKVAAGVDPAVLDRARTHERYAWLTRLQDPAAVNSSVGSFLRRHPDPESFATWWETYDALTPEKIAEVAKTTFVEERLTVGRLVHQPEPAPEPTAEPEPSPEPAPKAEEVPE